MSDGLDRIDKFKRNLLKELLSKCTEPQINLFNRMYKSIEEIPDENIPWAIQQIERTIIKNEAKQ
jgi:hypothetical protein